MATESEQYHPKDAIEAAINGTLILGGAGFLVSAVQNSLAKSNIGPWGVFTRTGGVIGSFAAAGGVYSFGKAASANLRERDDSLNTAIGGWLAGSVLGMRAGRFPIVIGYGALAAVVMGTFDYTGGALTGYNKDPEVDEFEHKQALRKNRRRPIEETISEIGEGRGIYGPGYEERRRQRIKETYGIDVPVRS